VDYFLLLAGAGLSLYLMHLTEVKVKPSQPSQGHADLLPLLGRALRLSEGIILLWPFFFLPQRLFGRSQGLTGAEWLWVLSWLGVAILTALGAWSALGGLPEVLANNAAPAKLCALWYITFVPAMSVLAAVLLLVGLFRSGGAPWTHGLSLALVIWPALPLSLILTFGSLG
jgi:hypothetical protein